MPRRCVIIHVSAREFVMEENIMKASTNDAVKRKFREVKGETNEKLRKLTHDPTLEGNDENKVGRIERKIGPSEQVLEK
jgi:hypothetical protein